MEAHQVVPIFERFSNKGEQFELRTVSTPDEIRQMGDLWAEDLFDPGFENLMQMWMASKDSAYWLVVVNSSNKVIATRVLNCISNGAVFAYNIKVHSDYIGRGLASKLQSHFVHMYNDSLHNNTMDTVTRSTGTSLRLVAYFHKILGYFGFLTEFDDLPKRSLPTGVTIKNLDNDSISKVLDYDESICKIDRRPFMTKWIAEHPDMESHPEQITLVAYDQRFNVIGYGTMRFVYRVFCVSPLYADSDEVAYCLMYDILSRVPENNAVFIGFPDRSRVSLEIVTRLKFLREEAEINAASGWGKGYQYASLLRGNLNKVFAIHDFWPI